MDDFKNIKKEMEHLIQLINRWNHEYYVLDKPSVDDSEYDLTIKKLIKLEKCYPKLIDRNSPTNKVGGEVSEKFEKFNHKTQMLSLSNVFSWEEFLNFNNQISKITKTVENSYFAELKIDGVSISLHYENSNFKTGVTRGDGFVGENVTENVRTIKSIPLKIPCNDSLEVRGEIYMPINEFSKINEKRLLNNEILFANPRNAAAGTLRQLDPKVVYKRNLNSFIYYALNDKTSSYIKQTQEETINYLKDLGFNVNNESTLCKTLNDVKMYIEKYSARRDELGYQIDGIVFKLNDFKYYKQLGSTAKNPKWAIAYKFPAEVKETRVLDIFPTVGRTGKITYNAVLEPTKISGTTVSACTLNNAIWIKNKGIKKGCKVKIKKAGDIIPEIISVVIDDANYQELSIFLPVLNCPVCKTKLEQNFGEVDQFCVNFSCLAKILKSLEHFVSRSAMNIVSLGKSTLKSFFESGIISNITDIYKINQHENEIINFENFGKKSYDKLVIAIEESKHSSLEKLIFALGIRTVGSKTAKSIAQKFKNIDNLISATHEQLLELNTVGKVMADSIIDWFLIDSNINLINQLKKFNVNMNYIEKTDKVEGNLSLNNLNFVLTGTLSQPREQIKEFIEIHGGKISSSLSNKTSYLVIGNQPSLNKLVKAEEINIKTITENELKMLIRG